MTETKIPEATAAVAEEKIKPTSPYARMEKKIADLEAKLQAQSVLPSSLPQSPSSPKEEKQVETTTPDKSANPHSHKDEPHYIGSWQHYCPTCGDVNPDFKDEVECSDCHTHLGAEATAIKLKACPNCGGTHARKLKK